jgi:hypothetical protein
MVKYDSLGIQQWVARFDGSSTSTLAVDTGGNVYVGGNGILKFGPDGAFEWNAYSGDDVTDLVVRDRDQIFAVAGGLLIRLNSAGATVWSVQSYPEGIALDSVGNIYATGYYCCGYGFTRKYTPDGDEVWSANVGAVKVIVHEPGALYVGGGYYIGVHKLSADGALLWSRPVNSDLKEDFDVDGDGNVYVVGTSLDGSGLHAARYRPDGGTEWTLQDEELFLARAIRADPAGNVHLVTEKENIDLSRVPVVKKYLQAPVITSAGSDEVAPMEFSLEQNYPNPFNPKTTIGYSIDEDSFVELRIFDILGRELATLVQGNQKIGRYRVVFDATGFASGVYFYQLNAGGQVRTKRLVVVK